MKPLISYFGGKQRLAAKIVRTLPPHTVYAEPFAGGLAVLFHKGRPNISNVQDYSEMINDHDERLITLYRVCQDKSLSNEFVERLRITPYSRSEFERARSILENPSDHDQVSRAWAYYVQAMMAYSNRVLGGWRTAVVGSNLAFSWDNAVDRVAAAIDRLRGVHIECKPALDVIRIWDAPQTCFYCDPPYVGAVQGHYGGYTQSDFEALLNLLDSISGSFVLSCYDNPALPKHWKRYEIQTRTSASCSGVSRSLVRDRTRKPTPEEMGNRDRTEILLVVDRSKNITRSDLLHTLSTVAQTRAQDGTWGLTRTPRIRKQPREHPLRKVVETPQDDSPESIFDLLSPEIPR